MTVGEAPKGVVTSAPLKAIRNLCAKRKTVVAPTMQAAVEELWAQGPDFIKGVPVEVKGLVFRQVDPRGVAGKAGIRDGNLMLKMGKHSYETVTSFMRALRRRKPGGKLRLLVANARGEDRREVVFSLAELR